jgi:TPR repeat protein
MGASGHTPCAQAGLSGRPGNVGRRNRLIMPLLLWNRAIVYQFSSVGLLIALFVGRVDCYEALAQDTPYARGAKLVKSRDYGRAAAAFQDGIASGDARCMDYLGYLQLEGLGSKRNPRLAFDYFRKAADLGNDQAFRNLGNMYFDGRDIACDPAEARRCWQKATELGRDPRPALSLAQLLTVGDGVKADIDLASKYWKLAGKLTAENPAYSALSDDVTVALAALDPNLPLDPAVKDKLQGLASRGHVTAQGTLRFFALAESDTKTFVKDVPFVHQAYNFCGLASSTMILRSKGVATSQFDLARKRSHHQWGQGTDWQQLVSVASQSGQKWKIVAFPCTPAGFARSKETLLAQLKSGASAIIDILENESSPSAHSIVICGYDSKAGEFLARNPALSFPGFQAFSDDRLKTIWRSRGFIPKNKVLQRPLIATAG